jgi:hypothetical protein
MDIPNREPDPDNPERVLHRDDSWMLVIVGSALLFTVILATPLVLGFVV